jgi:phage gp29-like protein
MGLRDFLGMAPKRASSAPTDGWLSLGPFDRDSVGLGQAFTKATINQYISSASQGDTRQLSYLKAEMATDAHLSAEIAKAVGMLVAAPFDLTPWPMSVNTWSGRKTREAERALEITSFCRDQLMDPDLQLDRAIEHAFLGLLEGASGCQVVWKRTTGGRFGLAALDPIPTDRFRWFYDRHALGVQPGEDSSELIPVEELGPRIATLVVSSHVTRRDRCGLLRRCLAPWLTARNGLEWWARDVEIFASPFRWAKYKRGDKEAPAKLREALRTMGNLGYAAFPDDIDLQFVKGFDTAGKGQGDLVGHCERSESKVILGSTQTSDIQVGTGARATVGVHLDVVETRVEGYGWTICEDFLRRQVLKPLVAASFGAEAAELHTPVPAIEIRRNADLLTFFQAMETAVAKTGVKTIPVAFIHSRTGIPQPEDGEPCLEPPKAPPAPVVAPGPPGGKGGPDPKVDPEADPQGETDAEDQNEPPEPPDPAKAEAHAARRPAAAPLEAAQLAQLEAWAVEGVESAGKAILAPYVALIAEVKRDGGDLGHLASRVRLQAQMSGEGQDKTADVVSRVVAHALLTGWAHEVGIEPPKAP